MKLNRKGLRKIIDMAIMGKINEVVIVHRDRLCRFNETNRNTKKILSKL